MEDRKQEMIARVKEVEDDLVQRGLVDDVAHIMHDFCSNFDLSFDVDYIDGGGDDYAYRTVYVDNLYKGRGYNVILDVDFNTRFESAEEFVDIMLSTEKFSDEFITNFKSYDR